MSMRELTGLVAAAGLAGVASGQDVTFRLVLPEQNLALGSLFGDNTSDFYVGSGPISVAYNGSSLFVGGQNNSDNALTVSIVEVLNFLDPANRQFLPVAGSRYRTDRGNPTNPFGDPPGDVASGEGWTGMDWSDEYGLLATIDRGSIDRPGQVQVFQLLDGATQYQSVASSDRHRGNAGPAWDFGPDGAGYLLDDGTLGPVAAVADVGFNQGPTTPEVLFGYDPTVGLAFSQQFYGPGLGGPVIEFPGSPNQTYGDMDIHPTDGTIVVRADNTLQILPRNPDGSVDGAGSIWANETTSDRGLAVAQNAEILHNIACADDLVIWSDRPRSDLTYTFEDTVKMSRLSDGSAASVAFVDPAGQPLSFPTRQGAQWCYFWSEADQLLFIVYNQGATVYAFAPDCGSSCPADLAPAGAPDGVLNIFDILRYFDLFGAGDPAADVAPAGAPDGVLNIFDILRYFELFAQGC